jgi:hypothetical protein
MNKFMKIMMFTMLMAPDGGDGGGGNPAPASPAPSVEPSNAASPAGSTDPAPEPASSEAPELPKYFSQLDPTKRDSDDYKTIVGKHKTPTELADAYVETSKRLGNAIEIPGKDAKPEQIQAFFKKLGVPETAEGYEFADNGMDHSLVEKLAPELQKEFMKAGLTKGQGKAVWNMISKNAVVGQQFAADQKAKQAQTFDARLSAKLSATFPNDADRKGAMQENVNLFKQHIARTGLGKAYEKAGLVYDPDFIMAIAKDEKVRSGSYVNGKPAASEKAGIGFFGNGYSSEFTKMVGGK